MSLPFTIALIAILDIGMLAALGWFMSRTSKLTPHISARHPGHRLSIVHGQALQAERRREERQERIAA
jgi:hypothetical protein